MRLSRTHEFDQLLAGAASWLLLGCTAWAALICAAVVLEAVTSGRLRATRWVGCPLWLRRVLLAGLGAALAGAPGAATAGTAASRPPEGPGGATTAEQRQLPVPARPLGQAHAGSSRVTVRPGDTLWQLAEGRLRSTAPAAAIANLVTSVHRRNRAVVGPDPDLIRPGQHLIFPTPCSTDPRGEP